MWDDFCVDQLHTACSALKGASDTVLHVPKQQSGKYCWCCTSYHMHTLSLFLDLTWPHMLFAAWVGSPEDTAQRAVHSIASTHRHWTPMYWLGVTCSRHGCEAGCQGMYGWGTGHRTQSGSAVQRTYFDWMLAVTCCLNPDPCHYIQALSGHICHAWDFTNLRPQYFNMGSDLDMDGQSDRSVTACHCNMLKLDARNITALLC